ncbi:FkbM family methyltransferase [bacterium]|nr:FkbM family methyltransferase [bacterium]
MPKQGLAEALKSVRYAGGVANWLQIGAAALRGEEVTRLRLRNGLEIESAPGALLVPLYKEIVYKDDYRLRRDPLPPGAVVIDVGANIGMFALHVAADHGAARVLAFEPFPESFALLQRNAARNRLDAIQPIPLAIAGQAGTRELHMQGRHGVHSLFGTSGEAVRIECITLADALARYDVARCDFLKLDCEGAEYEILLDAPSDAYARIRRIALEYHDWITDHHHDELVRRLAAEGFAVTTRDHLPSRTGYVFAERRA